MVNCSRKIQPELKIKQRYEIIYYSYHFGFFLSSVTYAQDNSNLTTKSKPNPTMRNLGIVLISTGVASLASGIALGVETGGFSYSYNNTNGYVTESGTPIKLSIG
jgi:hypothetical protein